MSLLAQVMLTALGLSLMSFGGAIAIVPELFRIAVESRSWLTAERFAELYAISQAAPGPNAMLVGLIGWTLTGWIGGLAVMLVFVGPTSVLAVLAFRRWAAWLPPGRQAAIREALLPVSVGLVAAAGVLITASLGAGPLVVGVVAAVAVLGGTTGAHPLVLLLGGAAIGALAAAP
ncbi:chromate transporter [Elioraea sp.]|uniref:chromate transporter n=1 Tax=Elioraea sp. TaxID=2185103 RepID=UPI00307F1657